MTNNVLVSEGMDIDIVNLAKYLDGNRKSALLSRGQVGLCQISRYHCFGVEAKTGKEHLHLLGRCVLRLIEDYEAIVKCPSSHISQRGYFYSTLFKMPLIVFRSHHLVHSVVQGAEIWIYLALKISGEKAKLLSCLDGRAGEYDP